MDYTDVTITILTVFTSAGFLKFLETRFKAKAKRTKLETKNSDGSLYRADLKSRVLKLESLLDDQIDQKDELMNKIILLTGTVEALKVKVEYLTKENKSLKTINANFSKKTNQNPNPFKIN